MAGIVCWFESLRNPGAFGENISTHGLNEADVCVGDVFRLGTVIVQVSQPCQPYWKLNLHFSRDDMSRRVQDTRRTGWYYRVLEPGEIGTGDSWNSSRGRIPGVSNGC